MRVGSLAGRKGLRGRAEQQRDGYAKRDEGAKNGEAEEGRGSQVHGFIESDDSDMMLIFDRVREEANELSRALQRQIAVEQGEQVERNMVRAFT